MKMINGHLFYEEQDICRMLFALESIEGVYRQQIVNHIIDGGYGMDTEPLVNVVCDPLEYNIDYLYSLDSEVTEEFINIMERFGLA